MASFFAHETSLIDINARIGSGTRIWQFCNIMDNVKIGSECNIGQGVFIESGVEIGNHVKIKNNVAIYNGVVCEDDVFLGPNCVFTNVINPRSFIERKAEFRTTTIKKGATIGANATIVCGHVIGEYSMIGAGSVVTKDIPDYALVMGNPARIKGYVCQCGERLDKADTEFEYVCVRCGKKYKMIEGIMRYGVY